MQFVHVPHDVTFIFMPLFWSILIHLKNKHPSTSGTLCSLAKTPNDHNPAR